MRAWIKSLGIVFLLQLAVIGPVAACWQPPPMPTATVSITADHICDWQKIIGYDQNNQPIYRTCYAVPVGSTVHFSFSEETDLDTMGFSNYTEEDDVVWWKWTFGEGNPCYQKSCDHAYNTANMYTVNLCLDDNDPEADPPDYTQNHADDCPDGTCCPYTYDMYVVDVDIDTDSNNDGVINNTDDPIEMDSPGRLIALNDDDDDNNSTPDREQSGMVNGEDDLAQVNLSYLPSWMDGESCCRKIVLEASSGGSNIKVWKYAFKDTEITLPATYIIGDQQNPMPTVVYVEGYNTGEVALDLAIQTPGGEEFRRDKVKLTVVNVVITHCPEYFVPGHDNIITYRLYPDALSTSAGCLQIVPCDDSGQPTGPAIYTSTGLTLIGGAEQLLHYAGDEITQGTYLIRIGIEIGNECKPLAEAIFRVKEWDLLALFWDDLTSAEKEAIDAADAETIDEYVEEWDPLAFDSDGGRPDYCSGVDSTTVTASKVSVTVWYWDETENNAEALYIDNGTPTRDISDNDWENVWGQDIGEKPDYDEKGSSITNLNGTFYSMSEAEQYFYLKIVVAEDGVLDNVGNEFDAIPDTTQREDTLRYKLKIDGEGNLTILEEVIE